MTNFIICDDKLKTWAVKMRLPVHEFTRSTFTLELPMICLKVFGSEIKVFFYFWILLLSIELEKVRIFIKKLPPSVYG